MSFLLDSDFSLTVHKQAYLGQLELKLRVNMNCIDWIQSIQSIQTGDLPSSYMYSSSLYLPKC